MPDTSSRSNARPRFCACSPDARGVGFGIANQRKTTVLWDRDTAEPVHNAITWQDTRTDHLCRELAGDVGKDPFRDRCGLPLGTYFSGPKIRWLLDRIPGLEERGRARGGALRDDGQLAHLEADRARRDRHDERQPDVGFWADVDNLRANWHAAAEWRPGMDAAVRERGYRKWRKAVERTKDWIDDDD
jgi:glycerol kinase